MKVTCSKDGKIILIAENGAEEFFLDRFLPINGGCFAVESWGREFVGIAERRLSVILYTTVAQPNNHLQPRAQAAHLKAQG